MAKRSKQGGTFESNDGPIESAQLTPVRVVKRELVSPDGSTVTVDVPVYPPFRLKSRGADKDGEESAA